MSDEVEEKFVEIFMSISPATFKSSPALARIIFDRIRQDFHISLIAKKRGDSDEEASLARTIACPRCKAPVDEPCDPEEGTMEPGTTFHRLRLQLARRLKEEAGKAAQS